MSSTISTKNVIILLETQQKLIRVGLPEVTGFSDMNIADYLVVPSQLRNLLGVTFEVSTHKDTDHVCSAIAQAASNLSSIHLRFTAQGDNPFFHRLSVPVHWPSSRSVLFSLATKLTILDYNLRDIACSISMSMFPELRALAVVDCENDFSFLHRVRPTQFPKMRAFMYKTADHTTYFPDGRLARFIQGLNGLRELVILGVGSGFLDGASLLSHAQTLELLCLHPKLRGSVFKTSGDRCSCLTTMTTLRHLSLYIGDLTCRMSSTGTTCSESTLAKISVCPALQVHLRSRG